VTRRNAALVAVAAVVVVVAAFVAHRWMQVAAVPAVATMPAPTYVGASACAACHANEAKAWRGSDHDLAMQAASAQSMLGNFDNAKFGTSTFFARDGKYFVNTEGPDGKRADFELKYAFGVRPLQQYLVELPGGRLQALTIAWDARRKAQGGQRWFDLYPGQKLVPGDALHWTGLDQNWNFQCAECHSTNLRKAFDAASDTFKTTWSEINVACEACHGPGSNHVAWAKGGAATPNRGLAVALDERRNVAWSFAGDGKTAKRSVPRTTDREIDTCGRCHARAARFADDWAHGKPHGDAHRRALLSDGLYWPDGQQRDEVYNWGSFLTSRMHAQGVTCSDCHDPHSLKLRAPGNAVCAQCHAAAAFDTPQHTHHATNVTCANCHMPTTTYMVVDPRHDHSFRVPRPDLTVALGVPNACNACHAKQPATWAAAAVDRLWGKERRGHQRFAEAFAGAAAGAPGSRGRLLTLIEDASQPAIVRATAIERLAPWLTPGTEASVARALNDADPYVRAAAVNALATRDAQTRERYLPRMLDDGSRVVRMDAAIALADARVPANAQAAFATALGEYVAAQTYNADRPEGHVNLGNLYLRRGDTERATAAFRKAIAVDPTFVPAYVNLADLYRARAMDGESQKVLRDGVARNPQAAALRHALGLALVRMKRAPEARKELAEATRLAPGDARYAYVYAVALADAGDRGRAQAVLDAAHRAHPYHRDVLEALAAYAVRDGKREAAAGYARTLRDLDPENAQYAAMLREIERAKP
jgi:predicted CXXCH cytochrome family protein